MPLPLKPLVLFVAALLSWGSACAQEDVIGTIKTVAGDASVVVSGQSSPAVAGAALRKGYVLKTGSAGSIGVTLKDNTILSAGPDSEIAIDDYAYAPGNDQLKLAVRMARGTLHYISGVIAKLKPESVEIRTPTGMIGVRGTEFVVYVDPRDSK